MGSFSKNIMANSFLSCARYNGGGEAVVCGDKRITWNLLTERILKISSALIRLGVKKGDKVAFMFHNVPEFIEINSGIQVCGAIPSPVNFRFSAGELACQFNHCDAEVMIYDSIWSETVESAAPRFEKIGHFICKGAGKTGTAVEYEEFVHTGDAADPGVETGWDDIAVMIYTGGTTGLPKGVMLRYGSHLELYATLLSNIAVRILSKDMPPERHNRFLASYHIPAGWIAGPVMRTGIFKKLIAGATAKKILKKYFLQIFSNPEKAAGRYAHPLRFACPSMPFFHVAGYTNLMLGMMSGGIKFILTPSVNFDPEIIFRTVESEKIFQLSNVPAGWKKLTDYPNKAGYNLESVMIASTGGGLCPADLKKRIMETFKNAVVLDAFGQTEMTPITSIRIDSDIDHIKDRSVGQSIVGVKIVNEDGNEAPRGQVGEISYSSGTVMKGYYKDEEKTAEVMKDGWFKSGDLGYIDDQGEIQIVGRVKECINSGGEKIFPLEVEQVIQKHIKVDMACVIGVPDEEWGEKILAVIQLRPGEKLDRDELLDFCRGKIAAYKIPRTVIFVDELPVSPAGKLLKAKVIELYGRK